MISMDVCPQITKWKSGENLETALTAGESREGCIDRQSMDSSIREIYFRNGERYLPIFSYPPCGYDNHWRRLQQMLHFRTVYDILAL